MSETIEILKMTRVDPDRRVAHMRIDGITIKSLWIVDIEGGAAHLLAGDQQGLRHRRGRA